MSHFTIGVIFGAVAVGVLYHRLKARSFKIEYVLFDKRAIIPRRATNGSVGYDIFTYKNVTIPGHTTVKIPTGFGLKLSDGYFPEIHARSSLSIKNTTIGAGIIDEDYTKEISVIFANLNSTPIELRAGTAIAQFKIHKTEIMDKFVIIKEFKPTNRVGGFGSTDC